MLKTAAILFVRNDIGNLGWWLAHHIAVGFSTLIVCDDHSNDGTAALLNSAASLHDIRVYQSDISLASAPERLKDFEEHVLKDIQQEFDWVLFLAVDEFLHLEHEASVHDFLVAHSTAPLAHWCVFGSNNHGAPAPFAPTERFTHHASQTFPDHSITRRFIRPSDHVTAPDPFSAPHSSAQWSDARILHFACGDRASFESKMSGTSKEHIQSAWEHFNQNEILFAGAQRHLTQTRTLHATMDQTRLAELHWRLTEMIANRPEQLPVSLQSDLLAAGDTSVPTQNFSIGSTVKLVYNTMTHSLQGVPKHTLEEDRHIPLILSVERPSPTTGIAAAVLTTARSSNNAFLYVTGVASLLAHIPLEIHTRERRIVSPVTKTAVTFPIEEPSLSKAAPSPEYATRLATYQQLVRHGHTLEALIHGIARHDMVDASALGCAIALLPPNDADKLSDMFPGLVPASVRPKH
ncbi:glycosyltransferase family 2 protein [Neokomagataea tanensis]|uniref:Glycosyltransferase family 2 protein n=1 Tax=Neokomagataea tanensis TaxID=661191 RepID=A0A4Y6V1W5_9PROT|nr:MULTISPECIES: glycosyltransferase family 2 protein [Neokomagataea]QDH24042.1 glycosyltransferase family 2 protein [Neokomagataea tanensis]